MNHHVTSIVHCWQVTSHSSHTPNLASALAETVGSKQAELHVKGHPGGNNTDQTVSSKTIHTQYNNGFSIWGERGLSSAFWNNIRIPVSFVCAEDFGQNAWIPVHQECWLKRITEEDRGIKQGTFWLDSALWPENGVLSVINYQHHHRFGRIHDIYTTSLVGHTMSPCSPLQLQLSCCLHFKSYFCIRESSCSVLKI